MPKLLIRTEEADRDAVMAQFRDRHPRAVSGRVGGTPTVDLEFLVANGEAAQGLLDDLARLRCAGVLKNRMEARLDGPEREPMVLENHMAPYLRAQRQTGNLSVQRDVGKFAHQLRRAAPASAE